MKNNNENLVIFGASAGAIKVIQTLKSVDCHITYLVDNDKEKWGKEIEGIQVRSPESLIKDESRIIIASNYQHEIEEQLKKMGILHRIALKEEYIMAYFEAHMDKFSYLSDLNFEQDILDAGKERPLLFGLEEGMWLGGIENLTFMLTSAFKKKKRQTVIISKITEDLPPKELENEVKYVDMEFTRYVQSIEDLVKEIASRLPCIVIDNWQNQIMVAVAIIKHFYPEAVKCISILHNDKIVLYRKTAYMEGYLDAIAGVSSAITDHLEKDFHISKDKLHYKESPVFFDETFIKSYTDDKNRPLQLGYAARITKDQKRADLLVPLIEELEKEKINYHFKIAGIGNYYDELVEQLEKKNLKKNLTICGWVDRSEMPDFWKEEDVFINLSEYEGTALSMLEAMSYGVVPVVTKIAGVDEFVKSGENGYIFNISDIKILVQDIKKLEADRTLLPRFGNRSRDIIHQKCSEADYVRYMEELAAN